MNNANARNQYVRIFMAVCLIVGSLIYLPLSGIDGIALADDLSIDPPPPPEKTALPEGGGLPPSNLPPEAKPLLSARDTEFNRTMAALEKARNAGPQAVVALLDVLQGDGLQLAMADILAAQEQLARPVPQQQPHIPAADRTVGSPPCTYATIAAAISAANLGDRLQLEGGVTFFESPDISMDLTLEGGYNGCGSGSVDRTTVSGISAPGSVFDITGGTVTLRNLNITGGSDTWGGGVDMLNIVNSVQVTLENTDVYNNLGVYGGGLYIGFNCSATLTNGSNVHNNTATSYGGGVRVVGTFNGVDNYSDIHDNSSQHGGGFAVIDGGSVYLNASDVYLNEATAADGKGGGVYLTESSTLTMTNGAYIYYENRAYDGAGVYADNSSVDMFMGFNTFRDNIATNNGGGLFLTNDSLLTSVGGYIGQPGSSLPNEAVLGAGIYAITSTVDLDGGYVYNNLASSAGAGIYATNSRVNLNNVQVGGTGPDEANQLGPNGFYGAGLYLTEGTQATFTNTLVTNNQFQSLVVNYGGGAFVAGGSVLNMNNSTIERHSAPSTTDGRGAGLYINDSTVTLENSQVISNTAGAVGGGLRMWGTSTLNMLNGSELSNNQTINGEGGGIAAAGSPDINISDSTIISNTAATDGGAIYLNAGTLDFTGGWDVLSNTAFGSGGAVAVFGTGDVDFYADGLSNLYNNEAYGDYGGAVYVGNSDDVELSATTGPPLYVYANHAYTDGGAFYAADGAVFDVFGLVDFDSNSAYWGNGGAFYLDGGSELWLDEANDSLPRFRGNTAVSGGAIYAAGGANVLCHRSEFGATADGNIANPGSGGAIYLSGSNLEAINCSFHHGEAAVDGGAIAAYTSTLTIDADYLTCDPSAGQCSTFYSNQADSDANDTGDGGAIYAWDSSLEVVHTYLHHNTAWLGGAIRQTGTGIQHGRVGNSLIYKNSATGAAGSGTSVNGGSFLLYQVTISDNSGPPAYSYTGAGSNQAHNSIAWGNPGGGMAGTFASASCNIDQNNNGGPAQDPLFVDPGAGENYHLQDISPAVNACLVGLPIDLENIPRPVGAGFDMGTYENTFNLFLPQLEN